MKIVAPSARSEYYLRMKNFALFSVLFLMFVAAACDPQSGIATKSVEKYVPTPSPERSVVVEEPINPADVITVKTDEGPQLSVNPSDDRKSIECAKYNSLKINGDQRVITLKGTCKQVMVNGDKNQVLATAFTELIVNGHENYVEYTKYVNGKRPIVTDNGQGNMVSKQAAVQSSTPNR